jgi:ABC-type sugar transport system ATPase subunit
VAGVVYEGVTKQFGEVVALDEFSLQIADGEFTVFVGPSGSGKTTALRCLAGLESISAGHIRIGGRIVDELPPRHRDIAMVFQNYALYPHMSVGQNLAYGLRMRKFPRAEIDRRINEAATLLDIRELLKRKPRELSGGQRQRVALGRALVREPQVFLMDEPLSNLDAKLRVQTRGEIKRLQQHVKTTTVYVTHDQVEAMTMGDRIVVMRSGVIAQVGTPEVVYEQPADVFVAGFIGSPAMSFGRFSLVNSNEGTLLAAGEIRLPITRRNGLPDDLIVGVRPEHTRLWNHGVRLVGPLDGVVEYVEELGRETFLGVHASGDTRFVVQVEGRARIGLGERVQFGLLPGRLNLFDPATELALGQA